MTRAVSDLPVALELDMMVVRLLGVRGAQPLGFRTRDWDNGRTDVSILATSHAGFIIVENAPKLDALLLAAAKLVATAEELLKAAQVERDRLSTEEAAKALERSAP